MQFIKYRLSVLFAITLALSGCIAPLGASAQNKLVICKKGKTSYAIFIDPSAPASVKEAGQKLQHYLHKATGASLKILAADKVPSSPYVSLGNTAALKAAGLAFDGISHDGFRITTKGRNIFIYGPDTPTGTRNTLGGTSSGTANGVYTFLEDYVGVRWLMPGELGEHIPETTALAIPALDRTESSPFTYRHLPHVGAGPLVAEWENRVKLGKVEIPKYNHAWAQTIPASMYDEHPTWFAKIGGKHLPPSARYKLQTTNPELVQAYADAVMAAFRKDPDLKWHSLSPSDNDNNWSDDAATTALLEPGMGPGGKVSRTRLVLQFYNDVARIVGREFPDHKLGGYIYASYLNPPKDGIPKLEPNLALMLATSISYGYQLYRPDTQREWDQLVRTWGESAQKDGFDIYFYDLPTALMQHNGIIMPPAPEILNFIFPRLLQYGFKGAYVYGRPVWSVFGASNYAIAKLKWDPSLDANRVLAEYYQVAYGPAAAPHIAQLYGVLDAAYRDFYIRHPEATFNLNPSHVKEIYAPSYVRLERHYLQAWVAKGDAKQSRRLELLGQVLSQMQWNLRANGLLPPGYASALTRSDEEIDQLLTAAPESELSFSAPIARGASPKAIEAKPSPALAGAAASAAAFPTTVVPVFGEHQLLLHVPQAGEVQVQVQAFESLGEFVRYLLMDADGKQIRAGVMRAGRSIRFSGEAGKTYLLDIPNRRASMQLAVTGAAVAYKANRDHSRGFRLNTQAIAGETLALYFYVPAQTKEFGVTMGAAQGVVADVYAPDGKKRSQLNTTKAPSSRYTAPAGAAEAGFWKVVVQKTADHKTVSLSLDDLLPQWFLPDAHQPLQITESARKQQ